jgi:putative methyltransferase (TIGR04325 family)
MSGIKKFIKSILSNQLISKLTGISYGWHGNYKSWAMAKIKCKGYDETPILDKVAINALKVKNGEISYERDAVSFDKIIYSFPVLASLMWISGQNKNKLNVLDFGGSLGTSYYQNLFFLKSLSDFNWCIVEQQHFVTEGNKLFADSNLHFFNSIDDCIEKYDVNAILLSGVIQYVEKPYDLLKEIISKKFNYILVDRTLFLENDEDRLTVQKVPEKIYKASYCCWFLSESKFLSLISEEYKLIYDFDIDENINIKSLYKGYFFKLKAKSE